MDLDIVLFRAAVTTIVFWLTVRKWSHDRNPSKSTSRDREVGFVLGFLVGIWW